MSIYGFYEHYWNNEFELSEEDKKEKKNILKEEFLEPESNHRNTCE